MQLSVTARNHILEALELTYNGQALAAGSGAGGSVTGAAATPKLQIWSGGIPANCAAAATGTKLVEMALPADFMSVAAAGVKALNGAWTSNGLAGAGAGTNAGYYRVVDNAAANCHEQGTVTVTGGGGDLTLNNINIANGQAVEITSKTLTAPNA